MDWFRDHLWETWLGLAALLAVLEMFSLDLVLLMLAAGALVGMALAILDLPFVVQFLAAAAAAVGALLVVRPSAVRRLHTGPELQIGHGKLVGRKAIVTEEISHLKPGRIRLSGEVWTAEPYDETMTIGVGETVDVMEIRGATAYVHPVPRLEA